MHPRHIGMLKKQLMEAILKKVDLTFFSKNFLSPAIARDKMQRKKYYAGLDAMQTIASTHYFDSNGKNLIYYGQHQYPQKNHNAIRQGLIQRFYKG
jgi:hypothetical protein